MALASWLDYPTPTNPTDKPLRVNVREEWDGLTDTPGSVLPRRCRRGSSGHPSTDAVADALQRPTRTLGRAALDRALSGLAPGGVYLAFPVTRDAGGLLHHRFTLTCCLPVRHAAGGLFSVALACGLPRVGVTHHPALRSPDFPRRRIFADPSDAIAQPTRPAFRIRPAPRPPVICSARVGFPA